MTSHAETDAPPPPNEWLTEWAVEVTWRDWRKAGAKGPTSQYGPFEHPFQRDRFLAIQRRDRDITATRVLTRRAVYTEWVGPETAAPISDEEREAALLALYQEVTGMSLTPATTADPERAALAEGSDA